MSLGSSIICCCQSPTIVSIANVIVSYPFLMQCSKVWCSLLIYCWYDLLERYNHYQLLKMGYSAFHQKLLDIYSTKQTKDASDTMKTIRELFIPLLEPCSFWPQLPCMSSPSFIYRSLWPNDIFGNETDNAVQTLLHIYFRHQTLGQTGCLAVVGPSRDLSQASTRLMELNLQIREALSQAQAYKPHTTMVSTGLWSGGTAGCMPGQTPHPPPYTELSSG